jgi:hypothetical protein
MSFQTKQARKRDRTAMERGVAGTQIHSTLQFCFNVCSINHMHALTWNYERMKLEKQKMYSSCIIIYSYFVTTLKVCLLHYYV